MENSEEDFAEEQELVQDAVNNIADIMDANGVDSGIGLIALVGLGAITAIDLGLSRDEFLEYCKNTFDAEILNLQEEKAELN